MAKAYWVSLYREISDPDKLAAYAKLALPAIAAGGGRAIVRGVPAFAFEHGVKERTVVIEFPDLASAVATHDGAAYKEALDALEGGAIRDFRIIEGVPPS
jgi:uncharacterized protein (DUF1330 family)